MIEDSRYRRWIDAAFRDYGSDPWFFLRELAQNSRDAGARTIRVSAGVNGAGEEVITFADDGKGMTYEHARRYLFRLYASSKARDPYAAGMYGIGFWTVLRYRPEQVVIESRHKKGSWGVQLDRELLSRQFPCGLEKTGTRVTLVRPAEFQSPAAFQQEVKKRLSHYCRYLRRNDRPASPLPIYYDGRPLNRTLELPGPLNLGFKRGSVEGVVGLGDRPGVKLYARGLPVWQGSVLDELSHTGSAGNKNYEIGPGLAPIFLLNGNRLEVNFSRRAVMDNRELKRLRSVAEQELSRLVDLYVDTAFPENRFKRWGQRLKAMGRRIRQSFWKKLLLILVFVIPLEIVILNNWFNRQPDSGGSDAILRVQHNLYTGATVTGRARTPAIDLSYTPPKNLFFKLFSPEAYDLRSGFIRAKNQDQFFHYYTESCAHAPLTVTLKTSRGGKIFLPQPSGYLVEGRTSRLNNSQPLTIRRNGSDELMVNLPPGGGAVRYRCCSSVPHRQPDESDIARLNRLPPGLELPAELEAQLRQVSAQGIDERVRAALSLTHQYLSYDSTGTAARKYRSAGPNGDWLKRVLNIGRGDCDILNGFFCVLLRRLGIPSRLAIGFIGRNGSILPVAHAWTEYFHAGLRRWHTKDASIGGPGVGETGQLPLLAERSGQPPTPTGSESRIPTFLLLMFILAIPPAVYFVFRARSREKRPLDSELGEIKENLARMAMGALLQPDLWGRHSSIWHDHIIPTVKGKHISLRRAFQLSRQGKLFAGHLHNPIVHRFFDSPLPILNLDDPAFARLVRLLPGMVDLDEIQRLNIQLPGATNGKEADRLLLEANTLLQRFMPRLTRLVWAPGLGSRNRDFFPIRLTPLHRRFRDSNHLWAGHLIGINPHSPVVHDLGRLFGQNRQLALFRLMDTVVELSGQPRYRAGRIREKTARFLLREIS
jgi:hypothetical protein